MEISSQFHTLAALPWGKGLWYLLDRRLGESQSWPECSGKEKEPFHTPAWNQTPDTQPIA